MSIELKNVLKVEDPTGFTYYLGTFTPLEIKNLAFVPVVAKTPTTEESDSFVILEERSENGYQRAGDPKRMKDIKNFIIDKRSCIIPPVLLSARGTWKFKPSSSSSSSKNFGSIQAEDLAAIIDGQHRLGGLLRVAADKNVDEELQKRQIPFMAIDEIEPSKEEEEFIDINDRQKGVKKSLTRYLSRTKNFSGQAAEALMIDDESVFYGRIDIQKKLDWILLLFGAAQECVDLMFSTDFKRTKIFDPQNNEKVRYSAIQYVLEYWKTVKFAMPEFWSDMEQMPPINTKKSKEYPGTRNFQYRLLEETGIRAFSQLASELFSITWNMNDSSPDFQKIKHYLQAMSEREKVKKVLTKPKIDESVLDIDPDLKSTGKAGVKAIYRHLEDELRQVIQENQK